MLPVFGLFTIVVATPMFDNMLPTHLEPLSIADGIAVVVVPVAWVLVQGAVITSFGLLLATWMSRVGRALALSVSVYLAVTLGGFILFQLDGAEMVAGWLGFEKPHNDAVIRILEVGIGSLNPAYSQFAPLLGLLELNEKIPRAWLWRVETAGLVVTAALAARALWADGVKLPERCLGRVSNRPRRPRWRSTPRHIHEPVELVPLQAVGAASTISR